MFAILFAIFNVLFARVFYAYFSVSVLFFFVSFSFSARYVAAAAGPVREFTVYRSRNTWPVPGITFIICRNFGVAPLGCGKFAKCVS